MAGRVGVASLQKTLSAAASEGDVTTVLTRNQLDQAFFAYSDGITTQEVPAILKM